MKAQELREKSVEELNTELLNLLREQFNLRMFFDACAMALSALPPAIGSMASLWISSCGFSPRKIFWLKSAGMVTMKITSPRTKAFFASCSEDTGCREKY